ncbi:MAG: adenylate/guanylate cyclase domain-containing protein [Campylobacterota bacterium]|nr:adenylate/guanylate cyclase domain-containing protein [Campylobacterota bacterium]
MKTSFLLKLVIAALLAVAMSWAYLVMPQTFFSLDNRLRDFMFVQRGPLPKNSQVVIVDIDEKSLKEYGQWPWSRDIVSQLLVSLTESGAGIIGLDIVFAEEDKSSPHRFAKNHPEIISSVDNYDEILADTLSMAPVIGGYIFTFEERDEENSPMIPAVFLEKGASFSTILEPKGIVLNTEVIQDSLYSSGFFNNTPDDGGMIRNVPLLMRYDSVIYPSLALEMVRIYNGVNRVEVFGDEAGVKEIKIGQSKIPTDGVGRLVVNFRGAGNYFKYISAVDIIKGDFSKEDINKKFILVGTSAVGLFDLRSIPFDSAIAGVEVHANTIDNILQGDFLYKPADIVAYDLMMIWVVIFSAFVLFSFIRSWFIIPVAVAVLYGIHELFFVLLFEYGMVLNLLFPFLSYSFMLVVSVGIDYIRASAQKDEAKRMLGKKVSPAVMEYLLEHSSEDIVASKELEATIFFSDIRSFTSISEKIGSPDRVIHMLNDYMTPMVNNIINRKGTIDKFIGDAIMAYWNAPINVKYHADEALKSAIEQIEMLKEINKTIEPEYDVTIAIGIGIHTGRVTAGDMGSEGRSDYTIIGDNVNLASRLEGLTKQYAAQILISDVTYKQLQGKYKIRPIDMVEVKGKNEAVEIYEVICSNKSIDDVEMEMYLEATKFFREANVAEAYRAYTELEKLHSSTLYKFYKERCELFLQNKELEFTPVLKMTTK